MKKFVENVATGTVFFSILSFFLFSYCLLALRYLLGFQKESLPDNPYAHIPLPEVKTSKEMGEAI